jgi:hypothetical protein
MENDSDNQENNNGKRRGHGVKGRSGPPGNTNAAGGKANLKHGYYSLVKLIRNRRGALDRRTILGKMVLETARQIEDDLGGDLSTAQRMLIADIALDTLLLQALNNEVADSPPIIKANDGAKAHPVYQLRAQLVAQRRETLKLLYPTGFKRVAKEATLDDLIAESLKEQQEAERQPSQAQQQQAANDTAGSHGETAPDASGRD